MTEFPKELCNTVAFDRSGAIEKRGGYAESNGAGQATVAVREQPKPNYSRMTKQALISEIETIMLRLTVSEREHIKQYEMTIRAQIESKQQSERVWAYKQVIRHQCDAIASMARV